MQEAEPYFVKGPEHLPSAGFPPSRATSVQSEAYTGGMQQLVEDQVQRRERMDEQLQRAEALLNERFGFDPHAEHAPTERAPAQRPEPEPSAQRDAFAELVSNLQHSQEHERED